MTREPGQTNEVSTAHVFAHSSLLGTLSKFGAIASISSTKIEKAIK